MLTHDQKPTPMLDKEVAIRRMMMRTAEAITRRASDPECPIIDGIDATIQTLRLIEAEAKDIR